MDMICQSINTKNRICSCRYPPTEEFLLKLKVKSRKLTKETAELRALLRNKIEKTKVDKKDICYFIESDFQTLDLWSDF